MSIDVRNAAAGGTQRNPINRRLARWAGLSLAIYELVMVTSVWGQWETVRALLSFFASRIVGNVLGVAWLVKKGHQNACMWILMGFNMLITLVEARALHWSLVAWIHVLCQVSFLNGYEERDNLLKHRVGVGGFLAISAGLALRDGCAPGIVGLFCLVSLLLYGMGEASHQLLVRALDSARENHRRLQQMQEQLVAHEKLSSLGMLAAGVAHEINNPMAFVTSNVRGLVRELKTLPQLPEELREYVDDVLPATLEGILRVNAIVADLRRFARNDLETPVEFDLNSEVASAIRICQGQVRDRCLLEVDLGNVPPLMGRPRQVGQVIINLILNAVHALPSEQGVVKVRTRAELDEVLVEVSDNGVGMSKEVLRHVFQPFFTTKPVGEGAGLGLAVAYGIVTGHGGRIDIDSEPGKGTRITVRLPATAAKVEEALATVKASLLSTPAAH